MSDARGIYEAEAGGHGFGQLLEVVGEGELEFDNVVRWVKGNGHEVVEAVWSGLSLGF